MERDWKKNITLCKQLSECERSHSISVACLNGKNGNCAIERAYKHTKEKETRGVPGPTCHTHIYIILNDWNWVNSWFHRYYTSLICVRVWVYVYKCMATVYYCFFFFPLFFDHTQARQTCLVFFAFYRTYKYLLSLAFWIAYHRMIIKKKRKKKNVQVPECLVFSSFFSLLFLLFS